MARLKREPIHSTSKQVAEMAGVSQATVSRVFSGQTIVSEKTVQKVMKAAEELGYKPNVIARSLSANKTNIIAVVLSDVCNPFYTNVLAKLVQRFQERNKQILFFEMKTNKNLEQIMGRVLEYQVDGVVVTAPALPSELTEALVRTKKPLVLFNRYSTNRNLCAVCSDNGEAGRMVANHLLDKGYSRFAFICGKNTSSGKDRCSGFVERLRERGYTSEYVEIVDEGDYTYEFGWNAMLRLYEKDNPPDGIFCSNDSIAMGALDAARLQLGLDVPGSVGIVGFDDVEMCSWTSVSLTTIRQPLEEMIDETCRYLFAAEAGEEREGGLRLFRCALVERKTT